MNKGEYNHLHGYQEQKDELNEKLDKLSAQITEELWTDNKALTEAVTESLAESTEYVIAIKYCYSNDSAQLLGAITLEIIGNYLSEYADELAEDKINE